MPAEADPLRRSKRNKFHLDVAGMHLGKRASSAGGREEKIPQRIASCYTHDDSSDEEDSSLSTGQFSCDKCPMKFTTKGGVSNHIKLHSADLRQHVCEHKECDFSCGSTKAMRLHKKAHNLYPHWEPSIGTTLYTPSTSSGPAHSVDSTPLVQNPECRIGTVLEAMVKQGQIISNRSASNFRRSLPVNGSQPTVIRVIPLGSATVTRPKVRCVPELSVKANVMRSVGSDTNIANMSSQNSTPNGMKRVNGVKRTSSGFITSSTPRRSLAGDMPRLVAINHGGSSQSTNDEKSEEDATPSRMKYVCPDCPFRTHMRSRLENHIDGHKREAGIKCSYCSYRCDSTGYIKRHESLHDDDRAPRLSKEVIISQDPSRPTHSIDKKMANKWARYESIDDKGQFKCSVEGCVFTTRFVNRLLFHKRVNHKFMTATSLHCPLCALHLCSEPAKKLHMLTRHRRKQRSRKVTEFYLRERLGERKIKTDPVAQFKVEVGTPEEDNDVKIEICDCSETVSPNCSMDILEIPVLDREKDVKEEVVDNGEDAGNGQTQSSSHNQHKCQYCPYHASNRSKVIRHEHKHMVKSENQCTVCTYSCRNQDIMEQHMKLHDPSYISPIKNTSSNRGTPCSESPAPSENQLSTMSGGFHRSLSLPALTPSTTSPVKENLNLVDSIKKKTVPSALTLSKNRKSQKDLRFTDNDGIRREMCPECPYTTRHFGDMKAHRSMHEGEPRKFACKFCTYSTKRFMSLKAHSILHGKKITKEKISKGHTITHRFYGKMGTRSGPCHARVYMCHRCMFVSKTVAQLWAHFRRHVGPVLSGALLCPHCNFKSVKRDVWIEHQEMHPGNAAVVKSTEGGFKCKECPFSAETYSRLWNHLQKHKKLSKFQCSMCSYSTGTQFCLQDHVNLHVVEQKLKFTENMAPVSAQFSIGDKSRLTPLHTPGRSETNTPVDNGESRDACSSRSSQLGTALNCSMVTGLPHNQSMEKLSSTMPTVIGPIKFPDPALTARLMRKNVPPHMKRVRRDVDEDSESSTSSTSVVFKCPDVECPYSDEDHTLYDLHIQMHAGRKRPYECNLCSYSVFTPESLHRHIEQHMPAGHDMKRVVSSSSRRLARHSSEVIPEGAHAFYCNQCSFRTVFSDRYKSHLLEHAQNLANRLMTQIKRSATSGEQEWKKPRIYREPKKSDKDFQCTKCGFRCQSFSLYEAHCEMHSAKQTFTCVMCDYSSETNKVVLFHEMNHHLDQPLTHLIKAAVLDPENNKMRSAPSTIGERVRLAGQEVSCMRCDWRGYEISALSSHFSQCHVETEKDKETALYLSMDMVPVGSILTSA